MSVQVECQAISDSSLGQELEIEECDALTGVMGTRELSDGEILVTEGDDDNTLFILIKGGLTVSSQKGGVDEVVYKMKVGEVAGTRAFVDLAKRRATLRAVGNTVVYTMTPTDFETLLDSQPRVVYKVMRALFRLTHRNLMRMNKESQALASYIHKTGGRF